ncbi:MAG: PrsW family glutamic-type intramembrane protease [Eubacteriales bacterium]|nr:PrsW family glutamic-type intramembrane protease [Eubacteriales bacterium]
MNVAVLLIAAYLMLIPVLYLVIRSGAFGKGSGGTLLKLFFLGAAVAVPAFLMEAGLLLLVTVVLRLLRDGQFTGGFLLVSCILRYVLATALVEELCKLFVLRSVTWKQMTMEKITDGTAASAVVGAGFSAVMILAWLAAWSLVPEDMASLRNAMPDFLRAGAVISFLFALLYIPSHFGYSGFMGSLYGVAKGSEQKNHGGRAGFMLFVSFMMPFLVHSACMVMIGYGIAGESLLWIILGLAAEVLLAAAVMKTLSGAKREGKLLEEEADTGVDFADSEEFADFAEAAGAEEGHLISVGSEDGDDHLPGIGGGEGDESNLPGAGSEDGKDPVTGAESDESSLPGAESGEWESPGTEMAGSADPAFESLEDPDPDSGSLDGSGTDFMMPGDLPGEDSDSWSRKAGDEEEISPQREISLLKRLSGRK